MVHILTHSFSAQVAIVKCATIAWYLAQCLLSFVQLVHKQCHLGQVFQCNYNTRCKDKHSCAITVQKSVLYKLIEATKESGAYIYIELLLLQCVHTVPPSLSERERERERDTVSIIIELKNKIIIIIHSLLASIPSFTTTNAHQERTATQLLTKCSPSKANMGQRGVPRERERVCTANCVFGM